MKPIIKCFTTFGALFILAFGLAVLAATIYLFFNNSIFLGNTTVQYTVLGVAFSASIVIISAAGEGIYGICKQRPKLICVFQVIIIVFVVLFIGLGVTLIFLPDIFFNGDCRTSSNVVIQYADKIYNTSYQMFCQGPCPCALDNDTTAFNNTYNSDQRDIIAYYNLSPTGANDSIDCITNNVTAQEIALFTAVGKLQEFLDCSLWCPDTSQNNLIFRFSNVNNGKPNNFCYSRLQTLYDDYSNIGKYCMFAAGGVMFLMFVCNMYICCCTQDRKGKGTAERFMYIVDKRDYEQARNRNDRDRYDRYDRFEESRPMYFADNEKRRR